MTSGSRGNNDSEDRRAGQPPRSMIAVGIGIGTGLGVAMGVAFGNLALGIAIGAAVGVAIGAAIEQSGGSAVSGAYGADRRTLWVLVGLGLAILLGVVAAFVVLRLR